MLAAAWLMLSSLLYSLQLQTDSFPKPLTEEEECHYLALAAEGDLEARNVRIERNLRRLTEKANHWGELSIAFTALSPKVTP